MYVGTLNGQLFALEQGGTQRWRVKGLRRIASVPIVAGDGRVYVGSAPGKLYAFNAMTGAPLWTYDAGSPLTSSPVRAADGTLYLTTRKAGLIAVAANGTPLWQAAIGKVVGSSPAIAGGTIFVGTTDGRLVAVDAGGNVLWQTQIPHAKVLGTPVVSPAGRVYVGAKKGGVSALDATTGVLVWTHAVEKAVGPLAFVAFDKRIVFAAKDEKLHSVLDLGSSPRQAWTLVLDTKVASAPAVDRDGVIFFGADDRRVWAVGPSGSIRWTYDALKPVRSAVALGVAGRVLVGADDRRLYAIGEARSGEDCWADAATVDADGSTPEQADREFQTLLAACGGPGADSCAVTVQGAVNGDRTIAANRIIASEIDPATYLAILRDRTRKLIGLKRRGGLCEVAAGDEDGDLVPDPLDHCPGTPPLTPTTDDGCTDSTLPAAPSADLVHQYLDHFYVVLDPHCASEPPAVPVLVLHSIAVSVRPFGDFISLGFDAPRDQAPGCGVWYEVEAFITDPDGTLHTFYFVLPRSKGLREGTDPNLLRYVLSYTDPAPFGDFVRAGAFYTGHQTHLRVRATNFRGARSVWSSM